MVFSSITFLFYFFPIALIGYYMLSFSRVVQNFWLLVVSLVFYAWGEPVTVFIMLGSIVVNWIWGLLIDGSGNNKSRKKVMLFFACAFNISLLGVFKYTNFIAEILYNISDWDFFLQVPHIALPIGISFFTFQSMSYAIDVYRGEATVQKNLFYLGLYIAFFPQLVAGPIVRYNSVAEQISNRKSTFQGVVEGCNRFAVGLVKKIIISNNLAVVADAVFDLSNAGVEIKAVPAMLAWLGAFSYLLQLYYDFSSYSDMAIGLGKMFGFQFEENFNYPLIAKSTREFMNRWHMSLQKWFSQYVYFPLGGSRVDNDDIMVRNLFVVWLLTGIWHGAAWNFIWWGLAFFLFITLEKVVGFEKWQGFTIGKHVYTIIVTTLIMTLMRVESMWQFSQMFQNMFLINDSGIYSATAVMFLKEYAVIYIAAIVCCMPIKDYLAKWRRINNVPAVVKGLGGTTYVIGLMCLVFFCVVVLAKGGYNPFIYFNF